MSSLAAYIVAVLLLLSWDVAVAGRIAQQRTAPVAFRLVSGVSGFLVIPALLVFVGGGSALSGRALGGLGWLWPAVTLLATAQTSYAFYRRFASRLILAPLVAFDLLIAMATLVRYADSLGFALNVSAYVPGLALAKLIAQVVGPATFASPAAVMVPVLAPGGAARSAGDATIRGALALGVATTTVLILSFAPGAHLDLAAYGRLGTARVTETPLPAGRPPLVVGLRVFPVLSRAPAAPVLRDDLALADSLGVRALLVRLRPEACTAAVLDSLDRALEPFRRDSTTLMVTLAYAGEANLPPRDPDSPFVAQRTGDLERIVRRMRPDYLVAAELPFQEGHSAPGDTALAAWKRYFTATALAVHRARPATRMVLTSAAAGGADSALFEWATSAASPIDATAFMILPHPGGGRYVETSLATADRWMARTAGTREHWVVAAAAPALEGSDAQRRLARHVLLWAALRPAVHGVVLADATDYDRMTGFRTAHGRMRSAVADAAAIARTLTEPLAPLP